MSRALREYQVLGIRTTIPFFLWLMRQPDYVAGRYDTTYLDRLLAERNGASFSELTEGDEELASIATALDAYLRTSAREPAGRAREFAAVEAGGAARGAARMTFDIDVNGRSRMVSVERAAAGRYRVVVDGRPHEMDAARVGTFGLSLLLDGDSGVSREVQVAPAGPVRPDARADRWPDGDGDGQRPPHRASRRGCRNRRATGEQAVSRPMPGRVVRVLVAVGDAVTARQAVVVVEAMKMENELRSPKDGRVKEVAVTAGASVEAGRVLVVIE